MNDEEVQKQVHRLHTATGVRVDPLDGPAQELFDQIVSADLTMSAASIAATSNDEGSPNTVVDGLVRPPELASSSSSPQRVFALAAVSLMAILGGLLVFNGLSDREEPVVSTVDGGPVEATVQSTSAPEQGEDEAAETVPVESEAPSSPEPEIELTAVGVAPTDVLFVRGGVEIVQRIDGAESVVAVIESPSFVESLVPVANLQVIVGLCCEPAQGNQQLLDLESGELEPLMFNASFPSVSSDRSVVVAADFELRAFDLEALLDGNATLNGETSLAQVDATGMIPRSAVLANGTVAATNGTSVSLVDLSGEVLSSTDIAGVRSLVHDEHNNVVIGLVETNGVIDPTQIAADALVLFDADTLDVLDEGFIETPATSIDVHDGWVLLSHVDGRVTVRSVTDFEPTTIVNASLVSASAWIANR